MPSVNSVTLAVAVNPPPRFIIVLGARLPVKCVPHLVRRAECADKQIGKGSTVPIAVPISKPLVVLFINLQGVLVLVLRTIP